MRLVTVCTSITAAAAVCLSAGSASAGLIAYDGFEYGTAADLDGKGAATNGWTTSWDTTLAGTSVENKQLTYSAGTVTIDGGNNAVRITNSPATNAINRGFEQQPNVSGVSPPVYFSFLFRLETDGASDDDFIHFMLNDDTTNNNSGGIGDIDTAGTTFGSRIGNSNGGDSANFSRQYAAGTTYLLVGRISDVTTGTADPNGTYERMTLWVNPTATDELNPGTDWTITDVDTGGTFNHVDTFVVRTFNLDSGDFYYMDELRIGTTFDAVVPEPSSLALLTLATPAILRRRRRA